MIRSRLAREKAHNILSMYKITEPPVDLVKITKLLGFVILPFDLPETMSAVIKIHEDKKVIAVNKNMSEMRQRFSVAHEIGHYLSGHESFSHERQTFVDREKKYLDPHYKEEEEADEFAAELLMPELMLKNDVLVNDLDAHTLAQKYKVSEQAMWIQLINLKLTPGQIKNPSVLDQAISENSKDR